MKSDARSRVCNPVEASDFFQKTLRIFLYRYTEKRRKNVLKILCYYLAAVSFLAVILTLYDKRAARKGRWRISENALLCVAAFGGSAAMLLTMLLIRHKTKHVKFMAGLPLILILQVLFAAFVAYGISHR